jgi:hypothetical protein
MSWVAPEVSRVDESFVGDERSILEGMLDRQRATLKWKCSGLTGEQLARAAVPASNLSLLGLIRHLSDTERWWFRVRVGGERLPEVYVRPDRPDAAFEETNPADAEADFERLAQEQELARAAVADVALDFQFVHPEMGPVTLRWVYNHMIEEYARHVGHADLIRQSIDGSVGE